MYPASTKQSGVTFAFPDVCKTPTPTSPFVPIPYPNVAAALPGGGASAAKVSGSSASVGQTLRGYTGNEPGTLKEMISTSNTGGPGFVPAGAPATAFALGGAAPTLAQQAAANQLRAVLASVHSQLLAMPGSNPNKWHDLVDTYVIAASDLYKVLAWR